MGTFLAFMGNSVYLCRVVKTKRSLKNVHIKVDRDTLQIFMKCREKRCPQWRASTERCLISRRITKRVAPSNPVFSRSFITSFGVASYRQGVEHVATSACPTPFLSGCDKKTWQTWSFKGKGVHLHRKTKHQSRTMKAYLYKEEAQPIEPIDEHKLAIAEDRPEKADVPKLSLYVVKYKPLWTATFIALLIFVVWALATWLLN